MAKTDPRFAPLELGVSPELYDEIRDRWLEHVTNEEKLFAPVSEEEWDRYLGVVLDTMTDDCVMEVRSAAMRLEGRDGARKFYETFIPSFADMQWEPQALVIGPQGVLDVADMTGTLTRPFGGLDFVNERLSTEWVIYFPWDPERHKFRGEIIFSIRRTD
jgi:SnoaL-like domain